MVGGGELLPPRTGRREKANYVKFCYCGKRVGCIYIQHQPVVRMAFIHG